MNSSWSHDSTNKVTNRQSIYNGLKQKTKRTIFHLSFEDNEDWGCSPSLSLAEYMSSYCIPGSKLSAAKIWRRYYQLRGNHIYKKTLLCSEITAPIITYCVFNYVKNLLIGHRKNKVEQNTNLPFHYNKYFGAPSTHWHALLVFFSQAEGVGCKILVWSKIVQT